MNVASQFYDVFIVIHLLDKEGVEGFHSWMWLNIDQLKPERATLIKRRVCNSPILLLPVNLFQPFLGNNQKNLCMKQPTQTLHQQLQQPERSIRLPMRWVSDIEPFGARWSSTGFALMSKGSNLTAKQRLFLDALISEEAMVDLRTAWSDE